MLKWDSIHKRLRLVSLWSQRGLIMVSRIGSETSKICTLRLLNSWTLSAVYNKSGKSSYRAKKRCLLLYTDRYPVAATGVQPKYLIVLHPPQNQIHSYLTYLFPSLLTEANNTTSATREVEAQRTLRMASRRWPRIVDFRGFFTEDSWRAMFWRSVFITYLA